MSFDILRALSDEKVFAPYFRGRSWDTWKVFLSALFALPMTAEQLAIYKKHTGRGSPPTQPHTSAWLICGRRSGKSHILALVACFLASFRDWRPYLAPGERATVMIVAADRRQARVIMRYCVGLMNSVPMLKRLIQGETRESISLHNQVTIECHTASVSSTRGYAIAVCLLDELAAWPVDESSAEPDVAVINAIKPGLASIPNSMMLCASSPHSRRGALFQAHLKHYAKDDDPVLVWQADTRSMNPNIRQSVIDEAMQADPISAMAEYGGQFLSDAEAFVDRTTLEACVAVGVYERAPLGETHYAAFCDPSAGRIESMALAIGHAQDDRVVLDVIREQRAPFSPDDCVRDFAGLLKRYNITRLTGDKFAGAWVSDRFRAHGISYEPTETQASDLFRNLLPAIQSRRIELLDNDRLLNQLLGLERRTSRGREQFGHSRCSMDDLANAVSGLNFILRADANEYDSSLDWVSGPGDKDADLTWQQARYNAFIMSGGRRW